MRFNLIITIIIVFSASGHAQEKNLPQEQDGIDLALEELLTDKGKIRLEAGFTYNASTSDRITGAFETIQTGAGAFVSVPTDLWASRREADTLIGSATLRYGLTTKSEVFFRGSAIYSNSRITDGITGLTTTSDSARLLNVVAGVNYRFLEDGKYPGLIGFTDITLAENVASSGSKFVFAKSGTIGLTAYKVIDPVVLSLTMGFRPALSRDVVGTEVDPGDTIFLNPSLAFAVNNELTLTGGLSMRFQEADEVGGVRQGSRQTRADMEFGVAYAWDQKNNATHGHARGCYW